MKSIWPVRLLFLFIFFLSISSLEFPVGSRPSFKLAILDLVSPNVLLPQSEIMNIHHVYDSLFLGTYLSKMIKYFYFLDYIVSQ